MGNQKYLIKRYKEKRRESKVQSKVKRR